MRRLAPSILALAALGCASHPPLLASVGGVIVNLGDRQRVDPLLGVAMPITGTPFGLWASATYNAEQRTWGSVSVGVTVVLIGGKP